MNIFDINPSAIFMIIGFLLSLYACVSIDVIQTLGTFLSTTRHRSVWVVWTYTGLIMVLTFVIGWIVNDGDMAFGRLDRIPYPEQLYWWHVLPPIILLYLTKKGIPVATSFFPLILWNVGRYFLLFCLLVCKCTQGNIANRCCECYNLFCILGFSRLLVSQRFSLFPYRE